MQLTRIKKYIQLKLLIASILINLSVLGQYDTVFKHRIQGILIEYSNNFKGLIGDSKLSRVAKKLFIKPGLEGELMKCIYEEIHLFIIFRL